MTDWAIPFLVSLTVCGLMVWRGPRDAPDGQRKLQARPVASSGGLGIAAGMLAGLAVSLAPGPVAMQVLALHGVALAILLVGLVDDFRPLDARLKLALLAGLSVVACWLGWALLVPGHGVPSGPVWAPLLIAGGALWLFVVMNAANFMDGSNGLALGSAFIMLAALGAPAGGAGPVLPAILGFLAWNLGGRLYAGDAGAYFVGFVLSALALSEVYAGRFSIWVPPLVALPFLADVLMTLAWRARRGERLMQPHRMHAYQLFRRAGWGHLRVAALWWAMAAVCGALAVSVAGRGVLVEAAAFAGALFISLALWLWQRRIYSARLGLNRRD